MAAARSINEEISTDYYKKVASGKEIDKIIEEMKADYYKFDSKESNDNMIQKYKDIVPGYTVASVGCCFDGIYESTASGSVGSNLTVWGGENGSGLDPNVEKHTITKIVIYFVKINEADNNYDDIRYEDRKFVVTLPNKKMYFYKDFEEAFESSSKEEGVIIDFI